MHAHFVFPPVSKSLWRFANACQRELTKAQTDHHTSKQARAFIRAVTLTHTATHTHAPLRASIHAQPPNAPSEFSHRPRLAGFGGATSRRLCCLSSTRSTPRRHGCGRCARGCAAPRPTAARGRRCRRRQTSSPRSRASSTSATWPR
eukprot:4761409-Pleurochrysis_carterae.AAC.3